MMTKNAREQVRIGLIGYEEIPDVLRNAIIAAEDANFFNHVGFNITRILVTLIQNVLKGDLTSAGASTLTMQLARNITLGGEQLGLEKTWQRKIREMYYTFHIEKRYTKREIFMLYCNQMWLGTAIHAANGVEAASRLYFGKSAKDLALEEAALIAGILQSPARQSPLVNQELAKRRRNYTLQRMADEGYLTQVEADESKEKPIQLAQRIQRTNSLAPYFIEEVRQHLEKNYGARRLYEEGLVVHTTLDATLQAAANKAVSNGLRNLDKRQGFRQTTVNILDDGQAIENFVHSRWRYVMSINDIVPAVVTAVQDDAMNVRFGSYQAVINRDGFSWTNQSSAEKLVRPGDLIEIKISTLDSETLTAKATLEQEPVIEAALLALENRTGRILAMVGGYNFDRSQFNRTTQAHRQLGSLFKGVLYATAIDQGYTATSTVIDEPISYEFGFKQDEEGQFVVDEDGQFVPDLYEPTNYDDTYEGEITLRRALEKSRNVPAVWMIDQLGPETVVDFAQRLGFNSPLPPFLSIALGSAEATLMEVTGAYSIFPNRGIRMIPYQIERVLTREGEVLEENRPFPQDAIRADTAYIMVSLMRGVVQRGTGIRASQLNWPLGGKTGTVDDYTDAWFVGFDPEITVGVWVGHDEKISLGDGEEGARVALPIWMDFMKAHIVNREVPEGFLPPGNIVFTSVDPLTGQVAEPWATGVIQEAFIAGTEPGTAFQR